MKNLLTVLIVLTGIITSCSPTTTAKISYKELPNRFKNIKISKEIIVKGDYVYITTIKGTPQRVDTKIFDIEIGNKKK